MKYGERPLKDIIKELIEEYNFSDKLNRYNVADKWEETVGKAIAGHTTRLWVSKRTLYVELNSSVVRSELNMIKSMIVERLNSYFDKPVIDKLVLK
ncbi:MAG: DUF721 domain-containing protein [Bacteroidales bacterium]|jgi:hypothetical protein|nr:DUF721 domain-containing protein [Bacteroidales bacterium]MDD4213965.1 DUF721 domain-containing protein [Bacteroidales bacterium]